MKQTNLRLIIISLIAVFAAGTLYAPDAFAWRRRRARCSNTNQKSSQSSNSRGRIIGYRGPLGILPMARRPRFIRNIPVYASGPDRRSRRGRGRSGGQTSFSRNHRQFSSTQGTDVTELNPMPSAPRTRTLPLSNEKLPSRLSTENKRPKIDMPRSPTMHSPINSLQKQAWSNFPSRTQERLTSEYKQRQEKGLLPHTYGNPGQPMGVQLHILNPGTTPGSRQYGIQFINEDGSPGGWLGLDTGNDTLPFKALLGRGPATTINDVFTVDNADYLDNPYPLNVIADKGIINLITYKSDIFIRNAQGIEKLNSYHGPWQRIGSINDSLLKVTNKILTLINE